MLISPAEPHSFYTLGTVSSLPEQLGVDFLTFSPSLGRVGIQRKELSDLVNSLGDRIPRELIDMKGLDVGIWLIEGTPNWSSDGLLMQTRTAYSWTQHQGLILSLHSLGFWVILTSTQTESMKWLLALDLWAQKEDHSSLFNRRKTLGVDLDRIAAKQAFIWQGFDGIGYKTGLDIVKHFGRLGLRATVDLTEVKGIGKKTAVRVAELLDGEG